MNSKKIGKIVLIALLSVLGVAVLGGIALVVLTIMITLESPRQYVEMETAPVEGELIETEYVEDELIEDEYIEDEPEIEICDFDKLFIDYENRTVTYETDSKEGILEIEGREYPNRSEPTENGLLFNFRFPNGSYDIVITTYNEDGSTAERIKVPNVYVMAAGSTKELKDITDINFLVLQRKVKGKLENISHLTFLKGLYVDNDRICGSLEDIRYMTALEYLDIDASNGITGDIGVLNEMYNLKYLCINEYDGMTGTLSSLSHLNKLEYLFITSGDIQNSITAVGQFAKLRYLWISIDENADNENNNALENLEHIKHITVFAFGDTMLDISNFSQLTSLEELRIISDGMVGDISSLAGLTKLKTLYLSSGSLEGDVSALEGMVNMEKLIIKYSYIEGDIASFAGMTPLYEIFLYKTKITGDIKVFAGNDSSKLRDIHMVDTPVYGSIESISKIKSLSFFRLNNTSIVGNLAHLHDLEDILIVEIENSPDIYGQVTLSNDKHITMRNGNSKEK